MWSVIRQRKAFTAIKCPQTNGKTNKQAMQISQQSTMVRIRDLAASDIAHTPQWHHPHIFDSRTNSELSSLGSSKQRIYKSNIAIIKVCKQKYMECVQKLVRTGFLVGRVPPFGSWEEQGCQGDTSKRRLYDSPPTKYIQVDCVIRRYL